jgi:hypothetical protein
MTMFVLGETINAICELAIHRHHQPTFDKATRLVDD